MFLIILHHFSVHGTFSSNVTFSFEKIANEVLQLGGKIGVNLFVLIGSYFLIGKKFEFKRVINVILNVIFYSYILFIVALVLDWPVINLPSILASVFPIPRAYWFPNYYILLLLCTPALNILIESFTKKQYRNALLLLTVVCVLIPSFFNVEVGYTYLTLFIYLYLIAGYIKIYADSFFENQLYVLSFFIASLALTIFSIFYLNYLGINHQAALLRSDFFLEANKLLTFTTSLSLFFIFKNINLKNNKTINLIAGSMFGVYLIHDNLLVRTMLWKYVDSQKINGGFTFLLYGILISLIIFSSCIVIDLLKRLFLDKYINQLTNKFSNFLSKTFL